jgi:RNA polymerase sigma-70 factor (ECF subfamily)
MMNLPAINDGVIGEAAVIEQFLDAPSEQSFTDLFRIFTRQLIAFFRSRGCEIDLSEDLAQEVMLTVYQKANQLRDRTLFHAWLFKIARNALCRHYGKPSRKVETVDLTNIADRLVSESNNLAGPPAFEFHHWMAYLESREREALTLRFVEEWEYHEIAAAKNIPIGTVQWRVFNAKKKLAPYLKGEKFQSRFRPKEAGATSRALDSNKTIAHSALPC